MVSSLSRSAHSPGGLVRALNSHLYSYDSHIYICSPYLSSGPLIRMSSCLFGALAWVPSKHLGLGVPNQTGFPISPCGLHSSASPSERSCHSSRCSSQKSWKLAPFLKSSVHNQFVSKSCHSSLIIYPEPNASSSHLLLLR